MEPNVTMKLILCNLN